MHLFHWAELEALVRRSGGDILAASATNFLSLDPQAYEAWASDPEMFEVLLEWELAACARPGVIDGGTHILVVAQRT